MFRKKSLLFAASIILAGVPVGCATATVRDTTLINKATLFMPGDIEPQSPYSASPALAPGSNKVFVTQSESNGRYRIMQSVFRAGKWSVLSTASFSGVYRDLESAYSPGGKYLIFASNRPAKVRDSVLDGHYNGIVTKGGGGNLWKVSFSKKSDLVPKRLPAVINSGDAVFSPAVTARGVLYFMRADSGGKFHIYRSALLNRVYQTPVKASFSLGQYGDYDPAVAPDESFLIFSSSRPPSSKTSDLFIVFRIRSGWTDPVDLRQYLGDAVHGIEARLSPDLTELYYSNSQNAAGVDDPAKQFIWKVKIAPLLKHTLSNN